MPNYYLSVLYKHIIQVKNKNVGLKVGGAQTYLCPSNQKSGGAHAPPASYASEMYFRLRVINDKNVLSVSLNNSIDAEKSTLV